jgi:hypothetical protein
MGVGVDGRTTNPLAWVILTAGPTVTSTVAAIGSTILSVKICYWKASGDRPRAYEVKRELAQQAFKGMTMVLFVFPLTSMLSITCANWYTGQWEHPHPVYYTTFLTVVALIINTPIGLISTWMHTPRIQESSLVNSIRRLRETPDSTLTNASPQQLRDAITQAELLIDRLRLAEKQATHS